MPRASILMVACLATCLHAQSVYEKDFAFAIDELGKQCEALLELKKIDWKGVTKELAADAKKVKSEQDHLVLLTRVVARLRDGHARVETRAKTSSVRWPADPKGEPGGFGIALCKIGERVHIKAVRAPADAAGVTPGSEVVSIAGAPALRWLEAKTKALRDVYAFSTDHHAFGVACHAGLQEPIGTRIAFELRDSKGGARKVQLTATKGAFLTSAPLALPAPVERTNDLAYGKLASGHGYVHVRRCKDDLPQQMDKALAALAEAPGLVLDFRGNTGGGFDHEAFLGRFVPKGETWKAGTSYASAGEHPFTKPIVVIVDASIVSAGETGAGIFKEDGRAWMIGESPTAGMSSQKADVELPSGLFALHVSVRSNKQRFAKGAGIEGLGVAPHELVPYDIADLAAGRDTLIVRAEKVLADFPSAKVPFKAR